jgi:predicted amidohydrolase YtcJ
MVAIRDNRILAVGKNREFKRYWLPTTRVIDLHGQFGCAGFNDAHVHLLAGGQSLDELDLNGCRSILAMQKRILERAWKIPWGSWIIGRGWDQGLFPDGEWPTLKIFSEISLDDYPVYLYRVCGHVVLVNRKVLQIAGITSKTLDPPGGEIGRDSSTGEPNGILKEKAIDLVSQYLPVPDNDALDHAIDNALQEARHCGVTSVQDFSDSEALNIYKKILGERKLTCRISLWFPLQADLTLYKKYREEYKGAMLRFGLLKGFLDGSMGSRTASFFNPYTDDPTNSGMPQMTQEKLDSLVLAADKEGFQIALHAIGDKAVRMGLDAYALAQRANGVRFTRHRIEHVQVVFAEDFQKFKAFSVVASMQPSHCILDMPWAEACIGPERCEAAYAWKTLLDHGAWLAFGSDWPVAPLNPLFGIYAAVTRCDSAGLPEGGWHPKERLTVEEAIRTYTLGSAFAEFMEIEKGLLEPGKLADIVVLDHNLLKAAPIEFLHTQVVYTLMDGKIVYEHKP